MAEQQTNGHDKKPPRPGTKGYKWTDAQRKKFRATMKANGTRPGPKGGRQKKKLRLSGTTEDALIYLRHAVASMDGSDSMAHLLTKLALRTLEGK